MNRRTRNSPPGYSAPKKGWWHLAAGLALAAGSWGCTPAPSATSDGDVDTAAADNEIFADLAEPASAWFEPPVIRPGSDPIALNVVMNNPNFQPGSCTVTHGRCGPAPCVRIPGGCRRVNLRSYSSPQAVGRRNGLVGPTLRIKAGDVVKVHLNNELPPNRGVCDPNSHNPPQCFDYTNLHTHGLHISPKDKSDNVLVSVAPRRDSGERARLCAAKEGCYAGSFEHEFKILPARDPGIEPGVHYPGTFWYHAHHHGSTAAQLASGMAGALIVEDPNEIPLIQGIRERVMVTQQLAFDDRGLVDIENVNQLRRNWQLGRYTTINGVYKPRVPMCPGEVQRWRLIDGGIFEMVPVELAIMNGNRRAGQIEAQIIATDGITMNGPLPMRGPRKMGPGYRVDLLVKAPDSLAPGFKAVLRKTGSDIVFAGMDQPGDRQVLAEIELQDPGSAACKSIRVRKLLPPGSLKSPLPDLEEVTGKPREVSFGIVNGKFEINGREFDHSRIHEDFQLKLGDTEEWTLKSLSGGVHPFHIHVNAFQVIRNGVPAEWRDTIIVPRYQKPGDEITIRTRYERFDGTFVLHCHILHHEDLGMMQLVRIDK